MATRANLALRPLNAFRSGENSRPGILYLTFRRQLASLSGEIKGKRSHDIIRQRRFSRSISRDSARSVPGPARPEPEGENRETTAFRVTGSGSGKRLFPGHSNRR